MLTSLRLKNFKIYGDPGIAVRLDRVTILLGENSAGKSTLMHAVQVLRQTWGGGDFWRLVVEGDHARLGSFENAIHGHDTERTMEIAIGFRDQGGVSRSVAVAVKKNGKEAVIESYLLNPGHAEIPAGFEAGVRVIQGVPPKGSERRGVWFDLDHASFAAWYGNKVVRGKLEWWAAHAGRVTAFLHVSGGDLKVVIVDEAPSYVPGTFELAPGPEPLFAEAKERWGRHFVPQREAAGNTPERLEVDAKGAAAEWRARVEEGWPLEWSARLAERGAGNAAEKRRFVESVLALGREATPEEWDGEAELRRSELEEWDGRTAEHERRVEQHRAAHAAEEDLRRGAWEREDAEFRKEFAAWKKHAEDPGKPLGRLLIRPIEDVLHAAVAQLLKVTFVGGVRLPEDRWTEVPGRAPPTVGPEGRGLCAVLAHSGKRVEQVNEALHSIGVDYQLETTFASDSGLPPAAYLLLRQTHPVETRLGLRDVGSGVRQLLPVLTEYESLVDDGVNLPVKPILFIEQPELHLHPRLQGDLMSWLAGFRLVSHPGADGPSKPREMSAWTSRDFAPQVVLETHGEVMVRRIGRMIGAGLAPKVALLVVHDTPQGRTVSEVNFFQDGEIQWDRERFGEGFFDQRFQEMGR